ncbi:MAG: glycosyltransferase family 4 protein [Lachnoclostridium sp.]|nr:glycosyltransferase family 4 protein [Lachnoclostridium sp.]
MRILFFFHVPSFRGGASKSGFTLVKELIKYGHEIYAIIPSEGELSRALQDIGVETECIRFVWAFPPKCLKASDYIRYIPLLIHNQRINNRALVKAYEFVKNKQIDIIHSNTSVINVGFRLAKKMNIPHITHYREFGYRDCGAIMLHENIMKKYKKQYGIAIGNEVSDFHKLDHHNNRIIYNGIIPSGYTRFNYKRSNYILYVGALYKEKGIEDLITAYSNLDTDKRQACELWIAGSAVKTDYLSYVKKLIKKNGISEYVRLLGERKDIPDLMYNAKALVVPSYNEAFGRIVVEGMNNGCLVIGRDTAGVKEQFDNGVHFTGKEIGLRFSNNSELCKLLEKVIISDIKDYYDLISRASETVNQYYTYESYGSSINSFYEEIISKN